MTPRFALICSVLAIVAGCGRGGDRTVPSTQGPLSSSETVKPWGTTPDSNIDVPPDVSEPATVADKASGGQQGSKPVSEQAQKSDAKDTNLFQWAMDRGDALAKAKKEHGYVVLKFEADWCGPCQVMKHEAFESPDVAKALKRAIIVPVDFDSDMGQQLGREYGTNSLPRMVFLHPDGKPFGVIDGYTSVDWLIRQIDRVTSKEQAQG
jgi:thioredoxin-related protein